ncbi:MAG: D-tyrosyl-tRNA(Tyr) deacylase [Clostridiales bacterium]|jgi:D-tyrosyl-tRNA(Tyr) deacylase|nr:D-tyrosyl-tRNA(Tyr) deacylase [Clostridiales bacterium]
MRSVIQRVTRAEVAISGETVGVIDKGVLALVAFESADGEKEMTYMLEKIIGLRIFEDDGGKMNLSVNDIGGGLLIVPNFTLYGDARHGKRPGYSTGAPPDIARGMFEQFTTMAKMMFPPEKLGFGVFQADMQVSLVNDGPVTLMIDSAKVF